MHPQAHPPTNAVVLVSGGGLPRVLARGGLEPRCDERAQKERHQGDHHEAADVLGKRELPADQRPEHEPQLPNEVRRRELEGEALAAEAPFWKRLLAIATAA